MNSIAVVLLAASLAAEPGHFARIRQLQSLEQEILGQEQS